MSTAALKPIPFDELNDSLMSDALSHLQKWFPAGKLNGREFELGSLKGDAGRSFKFNIDTGVWIDFADNEKSGKGLIALYAKMNGIKNSEAAIQLSGGDFSNIPDAPKKKKKSEDLPDFISLFPKCPELVDLHNIPIYSIKSDKSSKISPAFAHAYIHNGIITHYIFRTKDKQFFPARFGYVKGEEKWILGGVQSPHNLYNHDAVQTAEMVVIVEGELTADALQTALPKVAVVTWQGGAGAALKTNWKPIIDKRIVIWADADDAGEKAANEICEKILQLNPKQQIYVLNVKDKPKGWDAKDAIESGMTVEQIKQFIENDYTIVKCTTTAAVDSSDRWAWVNDADDFWVSGRGASLVALGNHKIVIDTKSTNNAVRILANYPCDNTTVGELLYYNIFENDLYLGACPPWANPKTFEPHEVADYDYIEIRMWFERLGFKMSREDIVDVVALVAKKNVKNPPKDWFEKLKWDGQPRLNTWLIDYLNAGQEPKEYLSAIGMKWMVAAVTRIYKPGAKFDEILVLEGGQGIGKSTALRILGTFDGHDYFTDHAVDIGGNKETDSLRILQGKIIVEMSEFVSFRKAETNAMKGFLSRQYDEYRVPWGRGLTKRARMFVFAGSLNPSDMGLFTDDENRRYLPFVVQSEIDFEKLKKVRNQLWAEAVHLYKQGQEIHFTKEENELARTQQKARQMEDAISVDIENAIVKYLHEKQVYDGFTTSEIMSICGVRVDQKSTVLTGRFKKAIKDLGWVEGRGDGELGKQTRMWKVSFRNKKLDQIRKQRQQDDWEF